MKFCVYFATLCLIVLVLNDQFQGGTAIRKKKILKKLKEFLPLLLALKGKKKLLLLPIPIPIKIGKAAPAWPSAPSAQPALSWPSMPESFSYLPEHNSWSAQPPSLPPTKITHSYLPADYLSDHISVKQKNDFLTSYIVKDGPGLEHAINNAQKSGPIYNSGAVSASYGGPQIYSSNSYREIPDIESRRPILQPINKPIRKQPAMFGQPISADDYENGKGSAPVYNDAPAATYTENAAKSNNNRIQFQTTSVSSNYNAPSYNDANNIAYKNEISNEDSKVKSVSGDYLGDANQDNYEESNELASDNVKDQPTYYSNSVPAMKNLEGYKKSKV